jgi:hypothetical protein
MPFDNSGGLPFRVAAATQGANLVEQFTQKARCRAPRITALERNGQYAAALQHDFLSFIALSAATVRMLPRRLAVA